MIVLRDSRLNQPSSLASLINPPTIRVIDFYSQQFLQVSRNIIRYIRTTKIFIKKKKEYNPHLLLTLPFLKEILFSFCIVLFFENFKN